MKSFGLSIVTALLVAVASTGCAQSTAQPTGSPTATASPSVSASATASASSTSPSAMTSAEAKVAFKAIAEASCNKAQAEGVVETDGDYTFVMVNKAEGYKDFSAAYVQAGKYALVWEIDGIASCSDWFTFSMAEEAGEEAAIDVTFNPADASFTAEQDLGEFGVSSFRFNVANGLIVTSTNLDPKRAKVVSVRYGNIAAAERKILTTAVDEFLAKN